MFLWVKLKGKLGRTLTFDKMTGLCWGKNSDLYGKGNFPYKEAAVRSIKLWHQLTEAKVVMTVVYSESTPSKFS